MISESETEPVSPIPEWVGELTGQNFLAVYDVVLDIKEALQRCAGFASCSTIDSIR